MDMGFTKIVAEKALFMTQAGVEKAMEWIEQHMDDADFQEELTVVTEDGKPKSKLSLEERQAAAHKLQVEIRAKHAREEKIRARENEVARKK